MTQASSLHFLRCSPNIKRGFTIENQTEQDVPDRDALASEYFELLPFEPYPVQEEALLAYFTGDQGVLVCAPTGTGKTLIAEAAVYEALRTGRQMYYTTPLIALTDQKLDELRDSALRWGFPADSVGLVTGNRRVNPDAPVLVVVAEILLNRLLNSELFDFENVASVVMDEFHSFNDSERGIVWELTLGLLPPHVRTLLLSATVGNSLDFTSWLQRAHGRRLQLVSGTERKVPLQYEWVEDEILADFSERIAAGDSKARRTPALLFCFSRSQCWTTAELLKGKKLIDKERQSELADYLNAADMSEGAGPKLKQILMRGVGVHHAGVLPRYRRMVEELFQRKLLSFCVCTETLAAGINLPARSVVLPSLLKGPRDKKKLVDIASAQQIFGRAGRPQFDDRGYVFSLAHEDDVKIHRWREKFDQIPEDTKDPGLLKAKKQLKKKMPKRRSGESYWTENQFEQLQQATAANLSSRGRLPWRLLAYLLGTDDNVQPIRDLVGRRLLSPKGIEEAQKDLNRMLITLWSAGYISLDPKPRAASPKKPTPKVSDKASEPKPTEGLFGELLDQIRDSDSKEKTSDEESDERDPALIESRGYEVESYRPEKATPTQRLERLVHLRSINPLFGVYLADQLAIADPTERIAALESVLEVPGTVARLTRMPRIEDMPPGTLATTRLDPQLLTLGLATPEELGALGDDQEEEVSDRGFGRVMFDEPRVWPLTIGEKILRLFRNEYPRVDNVNVRPVWIVGELVEFGGDFNKYVTARKLQKEEGILFRHCLRMVLLLDEMANIPPIESTVETWENPLDELADLLTESCRRIDPQSTDEMLADNDTPSDDLVGLGASQLVTQSTSARSLFSDHRKLMSGDSKGLVASLLRGALWLASRLYSAGVAHRNYGFDNGKKEIHRIEVPVISVGNLTTGGTGKTPVACYLAKWFREQNVRVAIVSRGYGRGDADYNDEALELHDRLPDVPHLQDADRVAAAKIACEELEAQLILMDDGFQHRRLHRDLDLVLIDVTNPFGFGFLLPRGLLREPVKNLRRADLVILTRCDHVDPATLSKIEGEIRRVDANIPILRSCHCPSSLLQFPTTHRKISDLRGANVAVVSAIGNPSAFEQTIESCGARIVQSRALPDHDSFSPTTVAGLIRWLETVAASVDFVVCTHKDLVKLKTDRLGGLDVFALLIDLEIQNDEAGLNEALNRVISS